MYFPTALLTALATAASWRAAAATPESAPARRDASTTVTFFADTGFKGTFQSFDLDNPDCVNLPPALEHSVSSLTTGPGMGCYLYSAPDCTGDNAGPFSDAVAALGAFDNRAVGFNCLAFN